MECFPNIHEAAFCSTGIRCENGLDFSERPARECGWGVRDYSDCKLRRLYLDGARLLRGPITGRPGLIGTLLFELGYEDTGLYEA